MSGSFNIDIEVGKGLEAGRYEVHCATLSEYWSVEKTVQEIDFVYNTLKNDANIKKILPKPPSLDSIIEIDVFLNQIGSNAIILKSEDFQNFLEVPQTLRSSLSYVSDKPFGKALRSGFLMKQPRFVKRSAAKRWTRLTEDKTGGALLLFPDAQHTENIDIIQSLKLGKSMDLTILKEIANCFVLRTGKRQWVLQANDEADFKLWMQQIGSLLTSVGGKVPENITPATPILIPNNNNNNNNNEEKKDDNLLDSLAGSFGNLANSINIANAQASMNAAINNKPLNKDELESMNQDNQKMKNEVDKLTSQIENMENTLKELKENKLKLENRRKDLEQEVGQQYNQQLTMMQNDWNRQRDNLLKEKKILENMIKAKSAIKNSGSGIKDIGNFFKNAVGKDNTQQLVEIDIEKRHLRKLADEERDHIKFKHKHLHRHNYEHTHEHAHYHFYEEQEKPKDLTLENVHTLTHTITHTNTQMQIDSWI